MRLSEEILRKNIGEPMSIERTWENPRARRQVREEELLEGELSAEEITLNNFVVRVADCLYKDEGGVGRNYHKRIPAEQEVIQRYKNEVYCGFPRGIGDRKFWREEEVREVQVVSAQFSESGRPLTDSWTFICLATQAYSGYWYEDIEFICEINKPFLSIVGGVRSLIVHKHWMGDSHQSDYWYQMYGDGTVEEHNWSANAERWKEMFPWDDEAAEKDKPEAQEPSILSELDSKTAEKLRISLKKHEGESVGTKVRDGAYNGKRIIMVDGKPCIYADPERGKVIFLSSRTMEECEYRMKKLKLRHGEPVTYYYYKVTFVNGDVSLLRMRKRFRDAMLGEIEGVE